MSDPIPAPQVPAIVPNVDAKTPDGAKRSPKWPAARAAHLKKFPKCAVCSGTKAVEVHHKKPFHLHPELELEPTNFITLCESKASGVNCHLLFGHLGNFSSFNPGVDKDAASWSSKMKKRPSGDPV